MFKRIAQPPVNAALRDRERHGFWAGFVVTALGALLLFCGARHRTGLGTVDGPAASETQLTKAFSSSGLQYASHMVPAPPPKLDDPAAEAEALERWARRQEDALAVSWKVRVDTDAKTPCPT